MADHTWTGAVDTDAGTTGNWTGGTPINDGTVIFPPTATNPCTTGLTDLGSLTGLELIVNKPNYAIGTAADHLELDVTNATIDMSGGTSSAYFVFDDTSDVADIQVVGGPSGSAALVMAGRINLTRGVGAGNTQIIVDPNATVTSVIDAGMLVRPGANLTIAASVTVQGGTATGGSIVSSSSLGTWAVNGGVVQTAASATLTATITSGEVRHYSTGAITLTALGSSRYRDNDQAYTISALTMDATADVDLSNRNITPPATIRLLSAGRGPSLPAGALVAITMP